MNNFGSKHTPEKITARKAEKVLVVTFEDGKTFEIPAELLRVESPSAEVQGHSPDEKKLVEGRSNVGIISVEQVGNYAIKIVFDDLHDSGIYTWDYLYHLGENRDQLMADYIKAMDAAGLSRKPNTISSASAPAKTGGTCGCGKTSGGCGG